MEIPKACKNVLGQTYGKQTAISFTGRKSPTNNYIWTWKCGNCGNIYDQPSGNLVHRKPEYCDECKFSAHIKHGCSVGKVKTKTYAIWTKMLSRAYYKYDEYQKFYNDVDVCDRWVGEDGFKNFLSDMGECPSKKHSLNRIRGAKVYSKETCEWATYKEQVYDQKRKARNSTGVTGVVWRKPPRNVWQANMRCDDKWNHYYYGESYNECVVCRVTAELLNFPFSRTLEDFKLNGINSSAIENGIDTCFWENLVDLHTNDKHQEILKCLYDVIVANKIDYKKDLNVVKEKINSKGEINVLSKQTVY